MDIADIGRWNFTSKNLGTIQVRPFTSKDNAAIMAAVKNAKTPATEIVRDLMKSLLLHTAENHSVTLKTQSDIEDLGEDELNEFARQFCDNNAYLLSSNSTEQGSELEYATGDSDSSSEFLVQAIRQKKEKSTKRMREFSGWTTDMINRANLDSESSLADAIRKITFLDQKTGHSPDPAVLSKSISWHHPVNNTNPQLAILEDRMNRLIEFGESTTDIMRDLQAAAAKFLYDFSIASKETSSAASKAIWVGLFAIGIAVVQIAYTEFWRVPNDNASTDAAILRIQFEIDQLEGSFSEGSSKLQAAITGGDQKLLEAIEELNRNLSALTQIMERGSQIGSQTE